MKVVIAEKPDQAMKLASPFPHRKQQGYLEVHPNRLFPKGAFFTWAVGHVCELVPPEAYNPAWKKWSIQTLPLIPETFRHQVMRSKAKQFGIIKQLLKRSDVKGIIHAGDAGREGELIVRTIVEQSGVHKPMKRLWISSLTEKSVTAGFESMLDETETRNLYFEAYSRSCADWLIGMNASRVYTILLKQKGISDVFSAGRVQTPTLALVVKREKEIAAFKPEPFWEVKATFEVDKKRYDGVWHNDGESRINDPALAERIAAFCKDKPAQVQEVETERKEFLPPYLFNLSSLQATANKLFKYSPQKTLEIAQKLYVKGILSYPRSDSSFVTAEEAKTFPEILAKLSKQPDYQSSFPTPKASIAQDRRYVNQKKVTDHYAIIPTEQVPNLSRLPDDERKIYDLVARRLIAAHHESALFDYTTLTTLVDGRAVFVSKGKVQIRAGWREVLFDEEKEDKESILPPLAKGDTGKVRKVEAKESKTQPPKRYTEGQLITLMKTAGKHLDNQELEKVLMKTEGLGTEATRAGIINMLKERKYIEVRKNQVFATQKGTLLIDVIGDKILASPEMTARWEQRLGQIGQGEASAQAFMEQVRKLSHKIVEDAVEQSREWKLESYDVSSIPKQTSKFSLGTKVAICKACGGDLVDKGEFYGCANYKTGQCNVTVSKTIMGKKISAAMVKKVMETGKSNLIKGFQKGKDKFDAYLLWDEQEKKAKVHRE
ncbi:DNA topoisomerase III [Brevibacillus choshinensis]|uniref:DNA topoisomerase n=1 Tax=Brevibacillus choshinensis TaxID=54911 RepID=A0ABR5N0Y7_BRECH|nr:DNA topoisomerase III [Brevibacillus choshinensis]KQL44160.1 DNA topoisomerase III [Brevibacillus choshinensis]MED4752076.1 DNA topoisomerase III [Brevibacillus choshinensis]